MLFEGSAKQYPNLVAYMNYVRRLPTARRQQLSVVASLSTAAVLGSAAVGGFIAHFPGILGGVVVGAIGAAAIERSFSTPKKTAEQIQTAEARQTVNIMWECLNKRRLHRDLDSGSMQVIEEGARHWARIRAVFGAGEWATDDLGGHYVQLRQQALSAADTAMEELVLLFRRYLPDQVSHRHPLDYVEEALEPFAGKSGGKATSFLPVEFQNARQIAEKLRILAVEAERAGKELSTFEATVPGASLDATIMELRAIRQAEDELQQDLRS